MGAVDVPGKGKADAQAVGPAGPDPLTPAHVSRGRERMNIHPSGRAYDLGAAVLVVRRCAHLIAHTEWMPARLQAETRCKRGTMGGDGIEPPTPCL